jgi:hypothetical protein
MEKECWQLRNLKEPTPCFQKAGGFPCSATSCLVEQRIQGLELKGIEIDGWWKQILPHSVCRMSSLSTDNQEYLERIQT